MTREQKISFIGGAIEMSQYGWEQCHGLVDGRYEVSFSVRMREDKPITILCSYVSSIKKAAFQGDHLQPADEDQDVFAVKKKILPNDFTMSNIDNAVNDILDEITKIELYG